VRRFIVFESNDQEPPREVERLDLDANMAIHGFEREARHPHDNMDVVITGGAGESFIRFLGARGVRVVATVESTPQLVVHAFLGSSVKSASEDRHHDRRDSSADVRFGVGSSER